MDADGRRKELRPNNAGQDCRTGGTFESAGQAEEDDEAVDHGNAYPAAKGRGRKNHGAAEGEGLSDQDNRLALVGVGDGAADEAKSERRREPYEAKNAEVEDVAGNLINLPGHDC